MKHLILILLTTLYCTCCNAQKDKETTTMKTTERFDVQYYKSKIKEVRIFHKNGVLMESGKRFFCSSIDIGIWREYDNQGNLIKETDEDKKFEKLRLKPINILRWLEHERYIDRKTGKGQERFVKEGDEPNIDIYFWLSTRADGSKTIPAGWSIDITEHGMRTTHSFNAETGEYLGKTTQVLYE